ncbi:hypothetical protein FH972_023950 [Carpinus fangiana]|uniref:Uncharacterized protein n=1 Tax=Carpinus fangiana TaxID=176857 RepID=A0A5N6KWX8_9ROSI|nr:hypothetical protein FH972_023950 [Carpinus fangiana]
MGVMECCEAEEGGGLNEGVERGGRGRSWEGVMRPRDVDAGAGAGADHDCVGADADADASAPEGGEDGKEAAGSAARLAVRSWLCKASAAHCVSSMYSSFSRVVAFAEAGSGASPETGAACASSSTSASASLPASCPTSIGEERRWKVVAE